MRFDYRETAKDLQTRIDIHQKYGGRDIDTWMLDLLAPKKGWRILDVGCGAGKQCEAFHRHLEGGGVIVGADISTELLAQAKQLGAGLGHGFHLLESDFNRDLPLTRERFDLVTCCFAIYYADDASMTIDEMHRVLEPG
ncbi:MAG: class I SAM-dependent methyltransferase, partial [Chloroflexi bacterium]|nr:class I SAM-dependent methyltransferase [Chloroflexota bacterium]